MPSLSSERTAISYSPGATAEKVSLSVVEPRAKACRARASA
jgi:hypothetical protein